LGPELFRDKKNFLKKQNGICPILSKKCITAKQLLCNLEGKFSASNKNAHFEHVMKDKQKWN